MQDETPTPTSPSQRLVFSGARKAYVDSYYTHIQGGLLRGGMTPALAPRRPVITEDVSTSRPSMGQYCQGIFVHTNKSCLNEEKKTGGIRFHEPAPNFAIRHTMTNSSRKQQQWCCSNNSIATHRAAAAPLCACKNADFLITQTSSHSSSYIFVYFEVYW